MPKAIEERILHEASRAEVGKKANESSLPMPEPIIGSISSLVGWLPPTTS